jgi:phytoene dehydrogenase-like protein
MKRTRESVIIIGAGIAGLSTGCYGQMNGYRTQIFELHTQPGGLCTAWKRKGYTFDGCIHHLAGSGPSSRLYPVWQELGAFQGRKILFHDDLVRVEMPDGQALTVYTDIDRLESYLKALAPEDGAVIDEYIRAARRLLGFDLLAMPLAKPWEMVRVLPMMPALAKWGKITLEQFAGRFRNPLLRQAFPTVQYDFPGVPMVIHLNFLAGCHSRILGWPEGGSLAFARGIAARYEALGGEIRTRSRVEKILVKDDRAIGVRLADGTEHRADIVVSAVSLGVARDMAGEPHALTLFLEQPVTVMGQLHDRLDVEIFNFDPALAPAGKTSLKVLFKTSYAYWQALRVDRARYDEEKHQIAETVIAQLDGRFPGLAQQVEAVDVATPLTIERFTGNWRGLQAWTPQGQAISAAMKGFTRTLPGLEDFYMAGQWGEAMIGISTAAISGRNLVERLCRQDKKRFDTLLP